MKTLSFTQYLTATREVTINIKDEELFRQKCEEWTKEEGFLDIWNLEEPLFQDCVELSYGEIQTDEEDNNEFYDLMVEENIETFDAE
jgi:hypothetical protein